MNSADRLARHVLATSFEDLPTPAVTAAKTFLLDTLGVGAAGSVGTGADALLAAARRWGGTPEAHVLVAGDRLPALTAAFVNSYRIHCLEYDCVHDAAVVHAMSVLTGALMAVAERRGDVCGTALITAIAVGVDVAATLGLAARSGLTFFRPSTAGAMAAAAALGRIAGLDEDGLKSLWGLTLGQLSGTMQAHVEGSLVLPLQVGFAARNAVTALDLAEAGFNGPRDALDGPFGYFALFETEADPGPALDALGTCWRVAELAHKPFPTGRAAQGTVDGLQRLIGAHGIGIDDVAGITCHVPPLVARLVGRPIKPDMAANYARLCVQFLGPATLIDGAIDVPSYTAERLADPRIHALGAHVAVTVDDNPDPNALGPQRIEVALKDGRRLDARIDRTLGAPDNPLSREQHLDKLRRNLAHARPRLDADRAEQLIARVDRLEAVDDVGDLTRLLIAQPTS